MAPLQDNACRTCLELKHWILEVSRTGSQVEVLQVECRACADPPTCFLCGNLLLNISILMETHVLPELKHPHPVTFPFLRPTSSSAGRAPILLRWAAPPSGSPGGLPQAISSPGICPKEERRRQLQGFHSSRPSFAWTAPLGGCHERLGRCAADLSQATTKGHHTWGVG